MGIVKRKKVKNKTKRKSHAEIVASQRKRLKPYKISSKRGPTSYRYVTSVNSAIVAKEIAYGIDKIENRGVHIRRTRNARAGKYAIFRGRKHKTKR